MEKLPTPANDNRSSVTAFPERVRETPAPLEVSGLKLTSMRSALSSMRDTGALTDALIQQAALIAGTPTYRELVQHINESTPADWERQPGFFGYILASFDTLSAELDG